MRKSGFTLAEVLITLAVIGVVAAMTLPLLIQNYQKQATVSKIKKFYRNFNQALLMAQTDYGDYNTWSYSSSLEFYEKYVKPYMTNVGSVTTRVTIYNMGENTIVIKLNDGTDFVIHAYGWNSKKIMFLPKGRKWSKNDYVSDIAKPKRQIFYFTLDAKGQLIPINSTLSRTQNLNACKSCSTFRCYSCTAVIYNDNWEISDEYPW